MNQVIATRSFTAPSLPVRERHKTATVVSDRNWDLALLCVAGYILTAVGRVHQLFPVIATVRPAVLTALFATALYLFDAAGPRRSKYLVNTTTKLVLVMLAWLILSVGGALVISQSFDVVFNDFVKTVLMCVVAAGVVRGVRDVERLLLAYVAAATLYAAVVVLRFNLGSGDDWRLGDLYYYDANDLATFAVTAMPFALYFLHSALGLPGRLCAALSLAILTMAFVRTGSRGGFIALTAVVLFIAFRYRAIPLRHRISGTALVLVVVLCSASDRYWAQMGTILSDADYNRTAESGRMQIWSRGIGYMFSHPLLGVGPGNFQAAEGILSPFAERRQFGVGVRWNAAHNSYVQIGAEAGIPGLLLFIAIIVSAFAALHRTNCRYSAAHRGDPAAELAQAITASLTGFVVGALFLSLAYSEILFTLLAFAIALQKVTLGALIRADRLCRPGTSG